MEMTLRIMDPFVELLSRVEMPPGTKLWVDPRTHSLSITPSLPDEIEASGTAAIHNFLEGLQQELSTHGWTIQNPVISAKEITGELRPLEKSEGNLGFSI